TLAVNEGNAQLFWLSRINKHSFHELKIPKAGICRATRAIEHL
ncbi:MAG: hypothetical protein ACI9SK_002350, partial [Zhongshania sp.]